MNMDNFNQPSQEQVTPSPTESGVVITGAERAGDLVPVEQRPAAPDITPPPMSNAQIEATQNPTTDQLEAPQASTEVSGNEISMDDFMPVLITEDGKLHIKGVNTEQGGSAGPNGTIPESHGNGGGTFGTLPETTTTTQPPARTTTTPPKITTTTTMPPNTTTTTPSKGSEPPHEPTVYPPDPEV